MEGIINAAFSRSRVVVMALVMVLTVGAYAYVSIPKEANPEVPLPLFYVSTGLDGISPSDAERLLLEPMETEFASIAGLDSMKSDAAEGFASIQLEFLPGGDNDEALDKVREAADRVESELPEDARDITITEINTALFPIITAILSGPVPERTLNTLAERLQEEIEGLEGVLEAEIGGQRFEFLEVLIDPTVFQTYNLSFEELIGQIQRNNRLIAAGAIETGSGRIVLKVPGLIEDLEDVMAMPVKVRGNAVVTFGDVATIRRTFEDPSSFARINGQPALALEVTKRSGANIIDTVADVKALVKEMSVDWPESVKITYLQDQSKQVKDMLSDLEANVIAAVILVMIVIVLALGGRSAILVGLSIPGAFLAGVIALWTMGYTMNIVVLFSLILVVGMLVDGAIVTTELADRKLQEGAPAKQAYAEAAKRMAWPIIASTATTLSVFFPLLFWDGMVGEFMKFLPITVILTLFASLFMALVFIPVVGGLIGKRQPQTAKAKAQLYAAELGDPRDMTGFTGGYVRLLQWAILRPGATVLLAVALLLGGFGLYGTFGKGVTFFPSVEPEFMQVQVRARDNFSIFERDALVRAVEDRILGYDEIASLYVRSMMSAGQGDEETIGVLQLELTPWDTRRPAAEIGEDIRETVADIAGIDVQVQTESGGPTAGKPVNLEITSRNPAVQGLAVQQIRDIMDGLGGFTDVTDTRPVPGVEVSILVNRAEAARFGADVSLLGQAVQLLTQGITVADYRPDDVDGSLDIRVRFPREERSLAELAGLRVPTSSGLVPISNFVTFAPSERTGIIRRIDEKRVTTIEANVAPGLLVNDQVIALTAALEAAELPEGVNFSFAGEAEDQQESMIFLASAFFAAIFMMFVILVIQFNNFFQAFIVMSAIVFSIAGVLLGLIITGRPFGVVMGGIGVIALAGIVVNNNIVLIDTYNDLKKSGQAPLEAALRTGAQRLRPVILTSVTTALGLMPMVIGVNLNFFTREVVYGAPSTQWWTELSSAIAGGLVIATVLTLIVTPAMLMLGERHRRKSAEAPVPAA
ncbi:efflux RND transporter permease subunit [Sulfitobacter sp. M57]|uniref:efflux RND transporter permease subunit n=1 Tax=unclassified Sulfitobacter TaxID=196795 RepID=UPI0023E20929|nr:MULTISPECIES: efflux RND transporter permease subunit [unclassified Sulfitobacter]MDF3415873.1 efflux RND transporter permease subunit [Sulfitobacter sp. KE5]MDF3423353.1 efflux RND transporter permease subunit [Sulfitobacter sp. KE43]MDF3434419.1 efflux RND transporter permease subunit [Sulfitobacter sp. KE42]MDF3460059.1 efflux RND transporter permease subunit [Sulfitobacter sp. S74]MDF3463957.1 efflux RND transporter permease subunit [Sulfitobacter sp. Ks18]